MNNVEINKCQNCHKDFVIEPEDSAFYEKIKVPSPTFCPECRLIRRMMFRNERSLYKRKCDAPGHNEKVISIYHKNYPFKVYDQKYWWSDNWDPMEYGRDYDFLKPFFEQFRELRDSFPLMSVSNARAENSEYCNVNDKSKDCHLISASYENERVFYSNRVAYNKDCMDLYIGNKNELCYEDVLCKNSYKLFFSRNSFNCIDSIFLYNCHNCQNCFCCSNLRNKQYYFFNKPCTKEEYLGKLREFNLGSFKDFQKIKEDFNKIYNNSIHRYANITKITNTSGDNVSQTKNCHYCFDIDMAEDCKFCNWGGFNLKDSCDNGPGIGDYSELLYETFDMVKGSRDFFTSVVYDSYNVRYGFNCYSSDNLFGCIGLRNKQYCILNKQYTKEEYESLVPKIIEHMNAKPYVSRIPNSQFPISKQIPNSKSQTREIVYRYGEFFPPELSPFAYNETIAQEYFPLIKEQALEQGYSWKEPEERNIKIDIRTDQLPDHIKDVKDNILGRVIECGHQGKCNEQCTTAFKIIEPELQFYRRMNLPLPRLCPNCRHYQRLKQRNPLKLWHRKCQCAGNQSENGVYKNTIKHFHGDKPCPNEFETTYAPERKEIVYCEKCYLTEVV